MFSNRITRRTSTLILLCGILGALPPAIMMSAQKSARDEINERLQLAQKLHQQGELIRATSELRQALGLTLEQLGIIYDALGSLDKATLAFAGAIEAKFDSDNSLLGLAIVYLKKREFEKGVEAVKLLLAQKPFHPDGRHLLGKLYFSMGRFDAAVLELEEAARLSPGDSSVAGTLAIAYLKQKRLENARNSFGAMVANLGESAQLHIFFGAAYRQTDFMNEAIAEFKRAVALNPEYPRAHYYLGLAYLSQEGRDKIAEANEQLQAELRRDPNDYLSNYLLGLVHLTERRLEEAVRYLDKAAQLDTQKPDAPLFLGQAYSLLGEQEKAIPLLERAIRLTQDPSRNQYQIATGHYLLAQAFRRQGKMQEAASHADLAAQYRAKSAQSETERMKSYFKSGSVAPDEINNVPGLKGGVVVINQSAPDSNERTRLEIAERAYAQIAGGAYNQLALIAANQSDFKRAARYFDQAATWYADLPDIAYNSGLAHFKAEEFRQAIAPLERARTSQPDRMPINVLLGLSYFFADDYVRAAQILGPLADRGIDDSQVLFALGLSLAHLGERQRGGQIVRGLLVKYPQAAELHLAMGQVHALEADYAGASAEFSKALEINPSLADVHYFAGLALLKQYKFAEAAEELRKELGRNPQHARAHYHLGFILVSTQQDEEALTHFEEAARLDPLYADAHYEAGKLRLRQGQIDEAIKLLERAVQLDPNKSYEHYQLAQAYGNAGRQADAQAAMSRHQQLKARERDLP